MNDNAVVRISDKGARSAAAMIGASLEEYRQHEAAGERWCRACESWQPSWRATSHSGPTYCPPCWSAYMRARRLGLLPLRPRPPKAPRTRPSPATGPRNRSGRLTHGKSKSPVFFVWSGMVQRCINPNNAKYADYGGRGIAVCERWQSFESFYADMGDRPAGMSLDRIDNDGPYSPENCRWATRAQQARNTRRTILVTSDGTTMPLVDLAPVTGLSYSTLKRRYQQGERVLGLFRPVAVRGGSDA